MRPLVRNGPRADSPCPDGQRRFRGWCVSLTELSSPDWVIRGGWTAAPTTLIDADIAVISGATDKVIRVTGEPDWLLAIDFQSGHDTAAKLPDLLLNNSALYKRPVIEVLIRVEERHG